MCKKKNKIRINQKQIFSVMPVPLPSSGEGCWWQPTHCTLQLQFNASSDAGIILPGCSYKGISLIRYRKTTVDLAAMSCGAETSDLSLPAVFNIPQHVEQLKRQGSSKGLHLHALTSVTSSSPKVLPLVIHKYKLTCLSCGKSDKAALASASPKIVKRGEVLKISKIVEDEYETVKDCNSNAVKNDRQTGKQKPVQSGLSGAKGAKKNQKDSLTHGSKAVKKSKSTADSMEDGETEGCDSENATDDAGSRFVYFENEESLMDGAEVELSINFTAHVQAFDQGGVFVPARVSGSDRSGMLLTHFEVRLARLAFPCPDHPAYRLIWTLQSIHVPELYGKISVQRCVFANSPCTKKVLLPHQHAAQYGFAPCGPIPAYLVAFAFFTHPLTVQSKRFSVPRYPASVYMDAPLNESVVPRISMPSDGQNSLLLRVATTVPCDVPWVLRVFSDALEGMENFFLSSIPLLVLLNDDEYADEQDTDEPSEEAVLGSSRTNEGEEIQIFPRRELTVLIAPTMPYISGMEHQGLICLNESLFGSGGGSKNNAAKNTEEKELERAMLIVHEIAHHWLGNAIGLPFSLKEGLCQVIEQHFGPLILGRPVKAMVQRDATEVTDPDHGKEFTLNTYRHALQALEFIAASSGFPHLRQRLRWLVREYVVRPGQLAEESGEFVMISSDSITGSWWPVAPYLSTAGVLGLLMSPSLPEDKM